MKYEDLERVNQTIKTTDIKGKEYAEVNQRIKAFRMLYPSGTIITEMLSNQDGVCIFKATVGYYSTEIINVPNVVSDFVILGTGTAYEKENSTFINKTSYIENCETSAVGRALGMCGIGIDTSIASAEEVQNAINNQNFTKEDAEKYVLDFGKNQGKTLREVNPSYRNWLYENNATCKQLLDLLGLAPINDEETLQLIDEFENLVLKYDIDKDIIYKNLGVKNNTEMTKEQYIQVIKGIKLKHGGNDE